MVPLPGNAPEDVVADAEGNIWTGVDDGRIIRITPDGASTQVMVNTGGRPLGLAVARDGRLLICDSHRGLLRYDPASGTLETLVAEVAGRALMFCSNVVESSDGTIFFTESTSRFHYEYYKGAVVEGRPTGSLFRRDPDGAVTVLASGLQFANGVTLTADESALVFAETTGCRLSKYWLTGSRAGSITAVVTDLPGYPDNISTGRDGRIWVAMVSERNRLSERLGPRAPVIRIADVAAALPLAAEPEADGVGGRIRPRRRPRRDPASRPASVLRPGHRSGGNARPALAGPHRWPRRSVIWICNFCNTSHSAASRNRAADRLLCTHDDLLA